MDFGSINWLAVLVCVVVSMIVGSIWFGRTTFFPIWWKAIGKADQVQPGGQSGGSAGMAMMWILTIVASFVQAIFMAAAFHGWGVSTLAAGVATGFLLWLGFVAATSLTNKLFANQLLAWVLEAGNHLVTFLLFGAILGAWH